MTTSVATRPTPTSPPAQPRKQSVKKEPKPITLEEFKNRYLTREDRYTYEWVNGFVEKTLRPMDQKQQSILTNLLDWLDRLRSADKNIGRLLAEVDTFFAGNLRRPDIAYFTKEQMAAFGQENQEPQFVIEVISNTDRMAKVNLKMKDYRRAGIPVIWHILPQSQEVHVYRGDNMTVCRGEKLCSAEPVISGFLIPAQEVFKNTQP